MYALRARASRRTAHQSSLSLPSALRAVGPLLSATVSLYTARMPMPLHNYRVSIGQVHRRVSTSLEKKPVIPISLVDSFLETCFRVKSVPRARIFIPAL